MAVFLGLLHIGTALSVAGYATAEDKDWKTYVYYEYNAWVTNRESTCGSGDGCMIYPVKQKVDSDHEVSLIWAAASFSLISGLHHLLSGIFWDAYRRNCIDTGFNWARWVDYAFSSGLMFTIISILFKAPPDLNTLVLAFSVQVLVICTGAASEALWSKDQTYLSKAFFLVASAIFLVPWVSLYIVFGVANQAQPKEDACGVKFPTGAEKKDAPDFVWGAIIGLFITFSSFAVCHIFKISSERTLQMKVKYEYVYGFLSFTSKIILLGNIGSGIIARGTNNVETSDKYQSNSTVDFFNNDNDEEDGTLFWSFLGGTVLLAILLGLGMLYSFTRQKRGTAKYKNLDYL